MRDIFEETCNRDFELGAGFWDIDPRTQDPVVRIPNSRGILIPFDKNEVLSAGVEAYLSFFARCADIWHELALD